MCLVISSNSSKSDTTVIKTVKTQTTSKTVMSLQRSGSLSSNCSHAVQCSSDVESNVRRRPCIKHTTPNNNNTAMVTNNTPKPGFPQSGSGRYKKSGLSQSYDDSLSAASNSSANSTYGLVRPVLKRLECAIFL